MLLKGKAVGDPHFTLLGASTTLRRRTETPEHSSIGSVSPQQLVGKFVQSTHCMVRTQPEQGHWEQCLGSNLCLKTIPRFETTFEGLLRLCVWVVVPNQEGFCPVGTTGKVGRCFRLSQLGREEATGILWAIRLYLVQDSPVTKHT